MSVEGVPITSSVAGVTMASLRTEILTQLGSNSLSVEVTQSDLDKCLNDAIRYLNRERPPTAWGTVTASSGVSNFIIAHPGLYGILDVDSARGSSCASNCDPFAYDDPMSRAGLVAGGLMGQLGDVIQQQQYLIQSRELTGRAPDWEQRWIRGMDGNSVLHLLLSDYTGGAGVMYEYIWHLTADDDAATGVGNIPPNDVDWVSKYATARAKQILGRVLRKYGGGINMPDGGTEQLDGGELTQEGASEQQALEATIRERRRPILPRYG